MPLPFHLQKGTTWFQSKKWSVHAFQRNTWQAVAQGLQGIVNAPTGSGKTYALLVPIISESVQTEYKKGLKVIWITPIKALAKEIELASKRAIEGLNSNWTVAIRTGDTTQKERQKIKAHPPDILITTPESLHLLLAQKKYRSYFQHLRYFVADEWHELLGSKRGVQIELGLSRLRTILPHLKTWGISATIGNLEQAMEVLLGPGFRKNLTTLIQSKSEKKIEVQSVLPNKIDSLPWAGHLGIVLLQKVIPILEKSNSTLLFTNTRSQAEIWYQKILEAAPQFAGIMAMHHSAISKDLRDWVENALHEGQLKIVVCTSSLDLGVDFRPVENIIQVGSPKGVSRFVQRAGRSGHAPGQTSTIHFVPTHALELIEASALRKAVKNKVAESRIPYVQSFDVLIQYLITLAVSDGFDPNEIYLEVKNTFCFQFLTAEEWTEVLSFITAGGSALHAYDDYHKVVVESGIFKVVSRKIALRHRLSIGTIVGEHATVVQLKKGKRLGTIEEWFISRLNIGDVFWFAGQALELVTNRGNTATVVRSKKKKAKVPSWQGGRMPLSSQMSTIIRKNIDDYLINGPLDAEMRCIEPLLQLQRSASILPALGEFLIEQFNTEEGHHVLFYPFEGRFVNEGIAALVAYRIASTHPISISIAINDYGFELLSDQKIPIEAALELDLFRFENLHNDIIQSVNSTEMGRKRFRDIATIAGLLFKGYPGKEQKDRHTQTSAQLIYKVLMEHEPNSLLLRQAFQEVLDFQLEEERMRQALKRINEQKIVFTSPAPFTPLAFPIIVDRLRDSVSTESLQDKIQKMSLIH